MSNRFSLWSFLAVLLALAGRLVVAVVGARAAEGSWGLASRALSVKVIALTVVAVYAFSILVDGCGSRDLGFAQVSWSSIAIGFVLAGFFIGIFGPLASWSLAQLGVGGFEKGLSRVADLPTWSLILTIVVVASAEELLYRAYAIERLGTLIGSRWVAAFSHVIEVNCDRTRCNSIVRFEQSMLGWDAGLDPKAQNRRHLAAIAWTEVAPP